MDNSTEVKKPLDRSEILEQLLCSQANFENLTMLNPNVGMHPIYKIAKMQLDDLVKELSSEEGNGG
jgi:hypothetical protein